MYLFQIPNQGFRTHCSKRWRKCCIQSTYLARSNDLSWLATKRKEDKDKHLFPKLWGMLSRDYTRVSRQPNLLVSPPSPNTLRRLLTCSPCKVSFFNRQLPGHLSRGTWVPVNSLLALASLASANVASFSTLLSHARSSKNVRPQNSCRIAQPSPTPKNLR